MKQVSREEILAQRFTNNGLNQPFSDIRYLLQASLGIQAQYLNHGLFNIANRLDLKVNETAFESLDPAILAWGQRQTYHFYDPDTWRNICSFLSHQPLWVPHYFESEQLNLTKASHDLKHRLTQPQLRSQLAMDYGEEWKKLFLWSALFLYHSRQGLLYHKWLAHDRMVYWEEVPLPSLTIPSRELLEAYFSFYGPASKADAAHFFGIRQKDIHPKDLEHLRFVEYEGKILYFKDWKEHATLPEVVLLGKFDPLLVSYRYKDILVEPHQHAQVWKKAGQISALLLICGKIRGYWSMSVTGPKISFTVRVDCPIAPDHKDKIRQIFTDYAQWTGKRVTAIRFN